MTTKDTKEEKLARGVNAASEPDRPNTDKDDAELVQEGLDADAELAKSYELPAEAKAQQMSPEDYAGMGPGAKQVGSTAQPGAKTAEDDEKERAREATRTTVSSTTRESSSKG